MSFWSFLWKCVALLIICIFVSGSILMYREDWGVVPEVGTGLGISFFNAIIGFAILAWGFRQSHNRFLGSVFGGIILRFLLIFSLLFVLIGALNFDRVALILSLVATYFLFMGLEIFQIHRYTDTKRK